MARITDYANKRTPFVASGASARNFLSQQMEKFLSNGDFEKPEGYTPVS